ncbi:MAG: ABC transporter permease, partial [Acidobacteriia bacterium]|nr:ABC transporter permease [Terriglobia bacterium]
MSTVTAPISKSPLARTFHIYSSEARYEFLKTLRQPAYVIPVLTFPLLFYVMFGLVFGGRQSFASTTVSTYMLATYGAFGVIGASLFGFAAGVSVERGFGWLQVKRASPMPPFAYLFAKAAMAMVFSLILVV